MELFQYDRMVHCELHTACSQSGEQDLKNHSYKARGALGLSKIQKKDQHKLKLHEREKSQPSTLDHMLPRQPVTH